MIYELTPEYDRAKSFYGKAKVEQTFVNGFTICTLYSYGTPVAVVAFQHVDSPIIYRTWDDYSVTTQRHIDEFLRQNCWDYDAYNEQRVGKKAWEKVEYLPLEDVLAKFNQEAVA